MPESSCSSIACRRFEGKVAIVTAATAGIGLGIAHRLGREGAKLVISSRLFNALVLVCLASPDRPFPTCVYKRQNNVDEAVQQLSESGVTVSGCTCHVGNPEHLKRLAQFAIDTYGKVDILVSNAAVNPTSGPILEYPDEAIDKVLEINIKSPILLMKQVVPHMKAGAAIVLVSSHTKTALVGLTKAMADELGSRGIRVNCIAPGVVPTKFASALVESSEAEQAAKDRTLLGRLGTPEDMGAAVSYLASTDASYVTGETLVVAGGMHSRL